MSPWKSSVIIFFEKSVRPVTETDFLSTKLLISAKVKISITKGTFATLPGWPEVAYNLLMYRPFMKDAHFMRSWQTLISGSS